MLALILVAVNLLLLSYFLFFAFFNYLYTFASFFYREPEKVPHSGKRIAVVVVSYNESAVLLQTLKACERLAYENKSIIAADDSDDGETFPLLRKWIQEKGGKPLSAAYCAKHYGGAEVWTTPKKEFVLIHRYTKSGFKAGSLRNVQQYLQRQKIQYMYLLDADWLPDRSALSDTLSVLEANDELAFVQTKRLHYNRLQGVLQHAASISEESGYEVEYEGRQVLGHPMLFTGCCTLFRVRAIKDVGGFTSGHLTEDIDLTNRFYLRGWKGAYLSTVANQGEVAPTYRSLIRQQERWAQGTARSLREFFSDVISSVHLSWPERISLLRQNLYYFTAVAIELSLLSAVISVAWLGFAPESYQANLYLYYMSRLSGPYMVLLFVALISNFLPLFVAAVRRRHFRELPYVFFTSWLFWSLLHTYFWANLKGLLGIQSDWFKTPKTAGKKTAADATRLPKKRLVLNVCTLMIFLLLYFFEWQVYGWISPYAYFWVPAMAVGILSS